MLQMIQNGLCDNFLFHSNFYVRTTPNATSKLPGGPDSPGPTARKSHSPCELRNNLRRKYKFEQHYPRARCWPRGNHREAFSRQRGPVAKAMLNQGPSVTCGSFIPKSSPLNLSSPHPKTQPAQRLFPEEVAISKGWSEGLSSYVPCPGTISGSSQTLVGQLLPLYDGMAVNTDMSSAAFRSTDAGYFHAPVHCSRLLVHEYKTVLATCFCFCTGTIELLFDMDSLHHVPLAMRATQLLPPKTLHGSSPPAVCLSVPRQVLNSGARPSGMKKAESADFMLGRQSPEVGIQGLHSKS